MLLHMRMSIYFISIYILSSDILKSGNALPFGQLAQMNKEIAREKLLLQVEEDGADAADQHPCCPHGPTVLFYQQSETPRDGFYACSAHRNPKLCDFHMDKIQWKGNKLKRLPNVRAYPESMKEQIDPDPTNHLEALSQDEVHAQYFFDQKALEFFADQCRLLKIK